MKIRRKESFQVPRCLFEDDLVITIDDRGIMDDRKVDSIKEMIGTGFDVHKGCLNCPVF